MKSDMRIWDRVEDFWTWLKGPVIPCGDLVSPRLIRDRPLDRDTIALI